MCLPYVPATTEQVHNVLRALKGRSGPLVDLGSGDGRIVSQLETLVKGQNIVNVFTSEADINWHQNTNATDYAD